MSEIEFTDRYEGMERRPSPLTSCKGGCEAIGIHPIRFAAWEQIEHNVPRICPQRDENDRWESFPPPDGWLFVYCATCGGSGRRVDGRVGRMLDKLYRLYYAMWFPFWAIRQTDGHGIRKFTWWFRFIWHETRYWG